MFILNSIFTYFYFERERERASDSCEFFIDCRYLSPSPQVVVDELIAGGHGCHSEGCQRAGEMG